MDTKELFPDTSRRTADIAVSVICQSPEIFKNVLDLALEDNGVFAMRAARALNLAAVKRPELVRPYLNDIAKKLPTFKTGGVKRCLLKTISERSFDYSDDTMGLLVNTCFDWVNDPSEEVAIKVYALEVLYRISQFYPDIKPELIASIENLMPEASSGIRVRGKMYLKKLYKEV